MRHFRFIVQLLRFFRIFTEINDFTDIKNGVSKMAAITMLKTLSCKTENLIRHVLAKTLLLNMESWRNID